MLTNLPRDLTRAELISVITRTGVKEEAIIYTNRCYDINHIMKIRDEQLNWLQIKKYLGLYRDKK
jgi:hypothetical protein